jgi:hypothetical protein
MTATMRVLPHQEGATAVSGVGLGAQGVLSGCSLAAGYGCLELPKPSDRTLLIIKPVATSLFALIAGAFLWRASEWQSSIRNLMGLEPVVTAHPLEVGLIAFCWDAYSNRSGRSVSADVSFHLQLQPRTCRGTAERDLPSSRRYRSSRSRVEYRCLLRFR